MAPQVMSYAWLRDLSVKQLKAAAHDLSIDTNGICEKAELIEAVRASPKRGKLIKKNVLAPGYSDRVQKKVVDREKKTNLCRAKHTDIVYQYTARMHDGSPRYYSGGTLLWVDKKKTVRWLKGVIHENSVKKGVMPMSTHNFHLRFFPGAPYGFNVLGAEVKYENPAQHGLSGQPRLLEDSETLEAAGFPSVEAYVRVESC